MDKLLIDARMVGRVSHGISRYVTMIAHGLKQVKTGKSLSYVPVFLMNSKNEWPEIFDSFEQIEAQSDFLSMKELIEIPQLLKKNRISVYHSTSFSSLLYSPCSWMQTVHDLNHLHYGSYSKKMYYQWILKPFLKKSKKILTVSQFSKSEIIRWLSGLGSDAEVIYTPLLQISKEVPSNLENILNRYQLKQGKYFFSLSSMKPHKNLQMLIQAFLKNKINWDLVLSTQSSHSYSGVRFLGGLSDEESRALLAGAGALVFPSLYEGFGLPPIEAAVLGTPLIVSDIPPHREGLKDLTQDEVAWLDPKSESAWGEAMVVAQEGKLKRISELSRAQMIKRYDLDEFGQNMDRIYSDVIREKA